LLIAVDVFFGVSRYSKVNNFNPTDITWYFFFLFYTFIVSVLFLDGIKYLSVSWNILRNLKKIKLD